MRILVYIIPEIFYIVFIIYQKYQLEDINKIYKIINLQTAKDSDLPEKKWHPYGGILRALIFVPFYFIWRDALLSAAICQCIWELGINKIALKQNFFYINTHDAKGSDKVLGKYKWYVLGAFLILAIAVKIFL